MPDLSNIRFTPSTGGADLLEASLYSVPVGILDADCCMWESWGEGLRPLALPMKGVETVKGDGIRLRIRSKKVLGELAKVEAREKIELCVLQRKSFLPFLTGSPKLVECRVCSKLIYPKEEVLCSVRGCQGVYHLACATEKLNFSTLRQFKCPQHACFLCKQKFSLWKCIKCQIAFHDKCAAFPEHVVHIPDQPGQAICWRHPTVRQSEEKCAAPTSDIEEIFSQLPLPHAEEEFKIDISRKDVIEAKLLPPPYVHIRRNIYLVKKKRDNSDAGVGCSTCNPICSADCVCRVQCISCSKACRCSEPCTNRPFRREKKIKIVKTEHCGWGVVAAEPINKDDFVIEYIGEVIDDATCERRLWDMKYRGVQNFYLCEIRKDFTIDATFKGNSSRFLNHSCDPNCKLEKWQVDGETRVGVFAARSIKVGEPLTYDYRFVQFGPEVECHCGAPNCQRYLGTKRKIVKMEVSWGSKRKRTSSNLFSNS